MAREPTRSAVFWQQKHRVVHENIQSCSTVRFEIVRRTVASLWLRVARCCPVTLFADDSTDSTLR